MILNDRAFRLGLAALLAGFVLIPSSWLRAGHFGFRGGRVGGISVNAEGVVRESEVAAKNQLLAALEKELQRAPEEMNQPMEVRFISLKSLSAAIAEARANNLNRIPDELQYLGGLTRIQYVLAYPEQNDIVIGGPAEGWRVDRTANVVGITSGRPVIQLEDLLVAFRFVHSAREEGISCSIDATQRGMQQYAKVTSTPGWLPSPEAVKSLQDAMGPYDITIKGVPADSHFARVLVAADYHMKRIAMNLDPSPLKELPSYMNLIRNVNRSASSNPRWWLACDYEPLLKSEDGLTWEIRGQGVKCLSEDDFVDADGTISRTGKSSPKVKEWAEKMTKHYDKLSAKNAIFGELRNIMDLCVVAALIEKEGLAHKVGLNIPLLTDPASELATVEWNVPKKVATHCSLMQTSGGITMTTSGGVQVDSWSVVGNSQFGAQLASLRTKAGENNRNSWWWQ